MPQGMLSASGLGCPEALFGYPQAHGESDMECWKVYDNDWMLPENKHSEAKQGPVSSLEESCWG